MNAKHFPDHWRARCAAAVERIKNMTDADAIEELCELLDDAAKEVIFLSEMQSAGLISAEDGGNDNEAASAMFEQLVRAGAGDERLGIKADG